MATAHSGKSSRASWRTPSRAAAGKSAPLKQRRVFASFSLLVCLVAAVGFIYWILNKPVAQTAFLILTTSGTGDSSANESTSIDRLHRYALPPLRYVNETIKPLRVDSTDFFWTQDKDSTDFSYESLGNRIETIAKQRSAAVEDTLVVWVRAQGLSIEGKPVLANRNFSLPKSSANWQQQLTESPAAIPVESLCNQLLGKWRGTIVVLLDWGNLLADPRAGFLQNTFMSDLDKALRDQPDRLWVLASHQSEQISCDNASQKQTLFGRACAEGLLGELRLPQEVSNPSDKRPRIVNLQTFADYVYRRVRADSGGQQTPWLLRGKEGYVSLLGSKEAGDEHWQGANGVHVVRHQSNGRLIAKTDEKSDEESDKAASKTADSGTGAANGKETAARAANAKLPEFDHAWQTLEQRWNNADNSDSSDRLAIGDWPLAAVAPATYKQLVAYLVDAEQRALAGDEFASSNPLREWTANIQSVQSQTEDAWNRFREQTMQTTDSTAAVTDWRNAVRSLALFRLIASEYREWVGLVDLVGRVDAVQAAPLDSARAAAADSMQQWLAAWQQWTTSATPAGSSLPWESLNAQLEAARRQMQTAQNQFVRALNGDASSKPHIHRLLLPQLLLQYRWSPGLRVAIRELDQSPPAPVDNNWRQPVQRADDTARRPDWAGYSERLLEKNALTDAEQFLKRSWNAENRLAGLANNAEPIAEQDWIWLDGRVLKAASELGRWKAQTQLPNVPAAPQPVSRWVASWIDSQGASFQGPMRAERGRPANIKLRLNQRGSPPPINVVIELDGVRARIAGTDGAWQESLRMPPPTEGRPWVSISNENAYELSLQVDRAPTNSRAVRAAAARGTVIARLDHADNTSRNSSSDGPYARLDLTFPTTKPLKLVIEEQVQQGGQEVWLPTEDPIEIAGSSDQFATLRPFPDHPSHLRFKLLNQDDVDVDAEFQIYAMQFYNDRAGRLVSPDLIPLFNLSGLNPDDANNVKRISEVITKVASGGQQLLQLKAPTAAPEPAPAGAAPPPKPAAEEKPPQVAGVASSAGFWVRYREKAQAYQNVFLQFEPRRAETYLNMTAEYSSGTVQVTVRIPDANDVQLPVELEKQPIRVRWDAANWLTDSDKKISSVELNDKKPMGVMTLETQRSLSPSAFFGREIQLDVDRAPRALVTKFNPDDRRTRLELAQDRFDLRSVNMTGVATFLADLKTEDLEKKWKPFQDPTTKVALFRQTDKEIQIELEVDTKEPVHYTNEPVTLRVGEDETTFHSTRTLNVMVDPASLSDELVYTCTVQDLGYSFRREDISNRMLPIEVRYRNNLYRVGSIVLDKTPPVFRTVRILNPTLAMGQELRMDLELEDLSGIQECSFFVNGAPMNLLTLTAADFESTQPGLWRLKENRRQIALPTLPFPPGIYEIKLQAKDSLDNVDLRRFSEPLRIDIKPAFDPKQAASQLEGPLKLEVRRNGSPPRNPVQVALDGPIKDKKSIAGNLRDGGNLQFDMVKAGKYKVTADYEEGNIKYQGVEEFELDGEKDWNAATKSWRKVIKVNLKPVEK